MLFGGSELANQMMPVVGIPDCENGIGGETTHEGHCKERVGIIKQKRNAEGHIQCYWEEILSEHLQVLFEGSLSFVKVE